MKKRNLRPQQAAPVARETNTTNSSLGEKGLGGLQTVWSLPQTVFYLPFAGDDAE